jgi:hypothetical protein
MNETFAPAKLTTVPSGYARQAALMADRKSGTPTFAIDAKVR